MNCTFFGHRFLTESISNVLTKEIISLINNGFSHFFVGSQKVPIRTCLKSGMAVLFGYLFI